MGHGVDGNRKLPPGPELGERAQRRPVPGDCSPQPASPSRLEPEGRGKVRARQSLGGSSGARMALDSDPAEAGSPQHGELRGGLPAL